MATVRISQLTAITTPTDDDVLIINDADTNTRKITFGNLTAGLLNTSGASQTKSGNLTVSGALAAGGNFAVATDALFVDAVAKRVGVGTASPNTDFDVDGHIHIRNQNELQLGDSDDSNHISLRAPANVLSNYTLTMPPAAPAGTSNIFVVDTSGAVTFPAETSYAGGYLYAAGFGARGAGANVGEVRLYEQQSNGSEYIALRAPGSLASAMEYTLPPAYPGTNGYVLSSDTTGTLSWVSNSASAAGSTSEVQYNTGGFLDSDSTFTFNPSTNTLSAENIDVGVDLGVAGDLQVIGDVQLGKTITPGGTTGAQTINQTAGSVNFAAAASSLVVTNSLVTSSSVVIATVATNDATLLSVQAVAGSGSFTLYANAAATAETRVNFLVIN